MPILNDNGGLGLLNWILGYLVIGLWILFPFELNVAFMDFGLD